MVTRPSLRTLALLGALMILTQSGCRQILMARAREQREKEQAAEKAVLEAFLADFKTAFEGNQWEQAAATFTLEREAKLKRYGVWSGNMRKLWYKLANLAEAAARKNQYGESVDLCAVMDKIPAKVGDDLTRTVQRSREGYQRQLDMRMKAWTEQTAPAREDEAAGRKACAAARYASAYGAPSNAAQAEIDAKICSLAHEVAAPWKVKVFVEKGKVAGAPGQAELAAKMEQNAREAIYGPAVEMVGDAASADVVVRFHLEAEKFAHGTTTESRSGQYVASQKMVPNPDIPKLQKEIAYWDKETQWKVKAAASIRCTGSGPCKSRIAHQNDAKKYRERSANLRQKLAKAPAQVRKPVYAQHSYDVVVHKWTLTQPITIEVSSKKGKPTRNTLPIDRWITGLEHGAQAKLGIGASSPQAPKPESMRPELHKNMAATADYLVHNNLAARNEKIVAKVKATQGLEKAEWVATYIALNPKANADNIRFANAELLAHLKLSGGGTALARKTGQCWQKK